MRKITMVELFGGIGAPSAALKRVYGYENVEIVDYVENNKIAVKAYNLIHNAKWAPKDVRDYHLPDRHVDILFHGSPCQNFSSLGDKKGGAKDSGTQSSLLWESIRIVQEATFKPNFIIWENVVNIIHKPNIATYNAYVEELYKLGYNTILLTLDARDFGIPQSRKRAFAISTKLNPISILFQFLKIKILVSKPPSIEDFLNWDVDPLENYPDLIEKYRVKQPSIIQAFRDGKVKEIKDYSYAITTKMVRWNNAGIVRIYGTDLEFPYRYLTPYEALRLMGFSHYSCHDLTKNFSDAQIYQLAGNSIVVRVLEAIFLKIDEVALKLKAPLKG